MNERTFLIYFETKPYEQDGYVLLMDCVRQCKAYTPDVALLKVRRELGPDAIITHWEEAKPVKWPPLKVEFGWPEVQQLQ